MGLAEQLENYKADASRELRARSKWRALASAMIWRWKLDVRGEEGTEIAEAAAVLPLVFMFLLGIIWFGRAFNIYTTITQAAQQGAITAARASCATCDPDFPVNKDTVADSVVAVLKASDLDESQIKLDSQTPASCNGQPAATCQTSKNITVCSYVRLNFIGGGDQTPQCGTQVTFQYPFQFYLPFTSLNQQKIILTAQAQSRMEQ